MRVITRWLFILLCLVAMAGCNAGRLAGSATRPDPKMGYVLVSIDSDFGGVLPIKPDSFWGAPSFLGLAPNKTYLLQLRSGGYSFGAIGTTRILIGWGTYGIAPFSVQPGKVVYLGKYTFRMVGTRKYSLYVKDSLPESLRDLDEAARGEITGLPIEHDVPQYEKHHG